MPCGGVPIFRTGDFLDFDPYCILLRLDMADRLRSIVENDPDSFDGITIPVEELCEIEPGRLKDQTLSVDKRFLIVADNVDCLSAYESAQAIASMTKEEQEALADKLIKLVTQAGLADASFSNIRLGKEDDRTERGNRKIYLVDTQPSNVMVLDQGWVKNLFAFQSSLEQAGRIGTDTLGYADARSHQIDARAIHFRNRLDSHIKKQQVNQYSQGKIGFYLISLIVLTALYHQKFIGKQLKPYFEKYSESLPCRAARLLQMNRKTYLAAVLSPIEIGLLKYLGVKCCQSLYNSKNRKNQKSSLSDNEKNEQLLRNPWMQRAARLSGQSRLFSLKSGWSVPPFWYT